ncbi:MAG TPA: hypothetical protein VGH97_09080 [Thermoanaerobaculia bacterium]
MRHLRPGLLAGALALSGLLLATAWASAQTPILRCSRCERCLSSACQDPPAKTSLAPDLGGPPGAAAALVIPTPRTGDHPVAAFARPLADASTGFRRPMRI